jgi:hypothetical protein
MEQIQTAKQRLSTGCLSSYRVENLALFRGRQQEAVDDFIHLSFFLEDLFGRAVDLVTIDSLSPYIDPHILREVEYVSIAS